MKKKLHQRKRIKPWSKATEEQMQEIKSNRPSSFTATTNIVAFAPETNSEICVSLSDEGECHIRMLREVGKDVFCHDQVISMHGAIALETALYQALKQRFEYDTEAGKKNS